jgi:hypothetical protein
MMVIEDGAARHLRIWWFQCVFRIIHNKMGWVKRLGNPAELL